MDAPELTNFGSLIRFALELEAETAAFYGTAAGLLGAGREEKLARDLAAQHRTRHDLLERTRREKLNEMVLEPITGLDGRRYAFDASAARGADVPSKAAALEQVAALFYAESAVVAAAMLTEAARTFRKLSDENGRNLASIREMFHG